MYPVKSKKSVQDHFVDSHKNIDIKAYFKQLKLKTQLGLLLAFLLPMLVLSLYFHVQFNFTLKNTGKLSLAAIAESQRNTVDLFLQERIINLLALFRSSAFSLSPEKYQMAAFLQSLREVSDAFIDVGFLNERGFQIGYAGPYPYLQDRDYSGQEWFITLMQQKRGHYISDIYTGFRNKLHFTIAVKQMINGVPVILRSTLDPDKFYLFLHTINHGKGAESFIIDHTGHYQVADPAKNLFLKKSEFVPPLSPSTGARELKKNGESVLVGYAWLKETNWAMIVSEPLEIAYAQFYRARRIMLISSAAIIIMVVATVLLTTRTLINRSQENEEKREELYLQLLHASKLASVGELATGVAHEINNPLAIIIATSGVLRDMFNPEFDLDNSPESVCKELDVIDAAVFRAQGITQQLLNYSHKSNPQLEWSDVHALLDDVLNGFKQREFAISDIEIVRDFSADIPKTMIDPNLMRQVFFNLFNNAGDAINGPGKITISTRRNATHLRITVTDTGVGMRSDEIRKIFDPFYTTKPVGKGTGLGLSVSLGIVESMGGTIEVQSMPGAGSAFTVVLPIKENIRRANNESVSDCTSS